MNKNLNIGDPILHFKVKYLDDPDSDESGILLNHEQAISKFGNRIGSFLAESYWKFPDIFYLKLVEGLSEYEFKWGQYH